MATCLLACAWGGGQGHVRPLRAIAEGLQARGHKVVLAVPNFFGSYSALADCDIPVLPVARYSPQQRVADTMRNFSDLLANNGFADPAALGPVIRSCEGLLKVVDPDLLIVDHAPTFHLAARGRVPVVVTGVGFAVPPGEGEVFPDLSNDGEAGYDQAEILRVINQVQRQRGFEPLGKLTDLYAPEHSVIFGLPELDVYSAYRSHPAIGPIAGLPRVLPRSEVGKSPPRIFAYLSAQHSGMQEVLGFLAGNGFMVEACLRDSNQQINETLRASGVIAHDALDNFAEKIAQAQLYVHHGNTLSAEMALALGRPQVCFTIDRDKELIADLLVGLGVSRAFPRGESFAACGDFLKDMCADQQLANTAHRVARELEHPPKGRTLQVILDHCESRLT